MSLTTTSTVSAASTALAPATLPARKTVWPVFSAAIATLSLIPASSSTTRILAISGTPPSRPLHQGQRQPEDAPDLRSGPHVDRPAVPFRNLRDEREPEAETFGLSSRAPPLETLEDGRAFRFGDSGPFILDFEQ